MLVHANESKPQGHIQGGVALEALKANWPLEYPLHCHSTIQNISLAYDKDQCILRPLVNLRIALDPTSWHKGPPRPFVCRHENKPASFL